MNKNAQAELQKLLEGNKNFVNSTPKAYNKTMESLKELAKGQSPQAIVLTCSDSRVAPEIIFDVGLGELFVVRTAGVGIGPNIIESIEFGIQELNIPLLIVLSHDNCGVISYAKACYPKPLEDFYALMSSVYPVMGEGDSDVNIIAKKHTIFTKEVLLRRSYIIREAYAKHQLCIAKAHFSFETGKVEIIEE